MERNSWLVLAAVSALQLLMVSYTFPLGDVFSQKPLLTIDSPAHWYRIVAARSALEDGETAGYDPFFQGGTAQGIEGHNPAAKLPSLVHFVLPGLSPAQVWKMYAFAASVLAPLWVVVACLAGRLGWRVAAVAGGLGLILWWVSFFRWLHTAGLVSFVFGAYLGLAYCAAVWWYLSQDRVRPGVLIVLGLWGALGTLIHPLFGIPVAMATVVFVLLNWRRVASLQLALCLAVPPVLSLGANWFWLVPVIGDILTATPEPRMADVSHMALADPNLIWMEFLGVWDTPAMGSKMYSLIGLGAVAGAVLARRREDRDWIWAFLAAGVVLVVYAALAAMSDLLGGLTQPNRFAPVGYLFLTPAAGWGLVSLWDRVRGGGRNAAALPAVGTLLVALGLLAFNANELRRELSYGDHGHYGQRPPEVAGLGADSRFILDWLETSTTPESRILFEVANGRVHDNAHIAGYLAYQSGREFIGGHYPFVGPLNFWDGVLVDRSVDAWTADAFRRFCLLYNIGWAVVHSDAAKRAMAALPQMSKVEEFREFEFYRTDCGSFASYFLRGRGQVSSRDHNDLRLEQLTGDRVVLKYHYVEGLRTEPPVPVEAEPVDGAVRPFIALIDPPSRVRLYRDR